MIRTRTKQMNNRTNRRGFTLIELLVVILILAILAALIVPRVVGRTGDAKRSKALADISSLSNMINTFHLDTGRFPTTEEGLQALRVQPSDVNNWRGPYSTKELPTDPWGNEYDYESSGDGFIITSYGGDGAPGGEGDNADIVEDALGQTQE